MKILVTGSEGNIGRKLVPYLRKCGHEVDGVDIRTDLSKDITSEGFGHLWFTEHYDVVFHLAALAGRKRCEEQRETALRINVLGTHNICKLCLEYGCKLIHFSTSEVYGEANISSEDEDCFFPVNWYGVTKFMGEQVVEYYRKLGLKSVIVRPFMIYDEDEDLGEYRSAIIRFAEALVKDEKIIVHKDTTRTWLYIDDAVILFEQVLSIEENINMNIGYDLGTNELYKQPVIYDLAKKMCNMLGKNSKEYIILVEQPPGMIQDKNADLYWQRKYCLHKPQITLEEGLKRVINRMKERIA